SFAYRVPDGWTLAPGQRVVAPLRGASRVGMIVALRDGADARLKTLDRVVDAEPVLSPSHLDLVHWIAAQSLSSVGSTCAALLPPPTTKRTPDAAPRRAADAATRTASDVSASPGGRPELLVGAGREKRALERIEAAPGAVLVIAADIETAARWAQRLARLGHAVRLDSGVPDAERVAAWDALRDGSARLAAGTRSALLAPLVAPATLVLIDEHEAAHKPPGPPRIHSRDVAFERAARERLTLLLTSATPSVEAWRRVESGLVDMTAPPRSAWSTRCADGFPTRASRAGSPTPRAAPAPRRSGRRRPPRTWSSAHAGHCASSGRRRSGWRRSWPRISSYARRTSAPASARWRSRGRPPSGWPATARC